MEDEEGASSKWTPDQTSLEVVAVYARSNEAETLLRQGSVQELHDTKTIVQKRSTIAL